MLISFTDEEINKLKVFSSRAQALRNRKLVKDGLPKVSIQTHVGRRISYEPNFPDEEDFRSLLIEVRTFYLQREPNNFYHVCGILNRRLGEAKLKEHIKHIKKDFEIALQDTSIGIIDNNKQLTSEDILKLWLNAKYFHSNQNKEKYFKQITSLPLSGEPYLKFELIATVFSLIRCILALSEIIEQVLDNVNK